MESQMLSLHSSHVLSVLAHYLDQLYKTLLGETPRYKIHVSSCIIMQCMMNDDGINPAIILINAKVGI